MFYNVDFVFEFWVVFFEGFVDVVGFFDNNVGDLFLVGVLVEKYVEGEVRNKGMGESEVFNGDIF